MYSQYLHVNKMSAKLLVVIVIVYSVIGLNEATCIPRSYGTGSVVCVDTLDHCDVLGEVTTPPSGEVLIVTSSKAGLRWNQTTAKWGNLRPEGYGPFNQAHVKITLDSSKLYQTIEGFGGAFTDSAGLNIHSVPKKMQDCIMKSYFSSEGLQYSLGRVPIGGADFSLYPYTYDDLPPNQTDENLDKFSLQSADIYEKIPLIKEAQKYRKGPVKLVASTWSAPVWMKDNDKLWGRGALQPRYYDVYARYIVRFLEEYAKNNVTIWGVTGQNEPMDGLIPLFPFNAMGWTAKQQTKWIGDSLGPSLKSSGYGHVKVFVLDDNRLSLPQWLDTVMSSDAARQFVSGVAVHWYMDWLVPASVLDRTNHKYPDVPILYTEGCTGQWPWQPLKVALGSWQRAQNYADDILDVLNHWAVGWIDWNLALNLKGGPNWANNFVDAPIIVNKLQREVYKQPLYYAIGHISKFITEGSVRIGLTSEPSVRTLTASSFIRPDGTKVLVMLNKKRSPVTVEITSDGDKQLTVQLPPSSISSLVWGK